MVTYHFYLALTITEMSFLKCLNLWKWHRMAMVDDDFISQLLTRFNLIFSFLPIMARILLNEPETNMNILYATMRNPKVCKALVIYLILCRKVV